jgi:hypothetical protein
MAQQEQSSGERGWAECSTIIIGRPREEPTAAILVFGYYGVRIEEDCGAEDPFECCNDPPILLSTFTHSKRFQHLGCALESDSLTFLLNRQRREKNGNDPVLAEGHAVIWVASDLKHKIAVPSFVK